MHSMLTKLCVESNHIQLTFYKLGQEKAISFLCFILSRSAIYFAATCLINQGCQADTAGTPAEFHWFLKGCQAFVAVKRASVWSVVFSRHCWGTADSYPLDCPHAIISLVRQPSYSEVVLPECIYLKDLVFFQRGIDWNKVMSAWNKSLKHSVNILSWTGKEKVAQVRKVQDMSLL